jgi:hypothetical protein
MGVMQTRELTAAPDEGGARQMGRARRSAEHWVVLGAGVAALVGLIALGFVLEPDARGYGTHEKLGLQPCMPMELWNLPCPGCGVTTAIAHAARGNLWSAIRTQPFGFLVALGLVGFIGWAAVGQLRGRDLWVDLQGRAWGRWAAIAGVLMALAWLYKIAVVRGW